VEIRAMSCGMGRALRFAGASFDGAGGVDMSAVLAQPVVTHPMRHAWL
jgi:hypothetical protein